MQKNIQKSFKEQAAEQMRDEAMRLAKATQRPNQTKQQTKLIAQGIAKGIEIYKNQQKEKARNLDRGRKKVARKAAQFENAQCDVPEHRAPVLSNQASFTLGFCGIFFGLLSVLFFSLSILDIKVEIAVYSFSHAVFIPTGMVMLVLSIWMFWARR